MSSPITHLTDFSDRLSPMLVKELRQGLRAKTFIAVFLSLQAFLALMLLIASATSAEENSGTVVSTTIFIFAAIAVMIVQPLRGVAALATEVKSNTIEMIVLTRLSAQRIVLGKWIALVSQSALILSTVIPYLILRYFFGGMNLIGEVVLLGLIFFSSMVLTAITVGMSGNTSALLRAILPVLIVPFALYLFSFGFRSNGLLESCMLDNKQSIITVLTFLIVSAYLGGSALSLGVSLIAPPAENHSSIRRLISLLALAAIATIAHFGTIDKNLYLFMIMLIVAPAMMTALTESAPLIPTVCRPFVKRGSLGKLAGMLLYPGLAYGILFSVVLMSAAMLAFQLHPANGYSNDEFVAFLALLGSILMPALFQLIFFKGKGQRVASYFLVFVGSGVFALMIAALTNAMSNKGILWLVIWDPFVFLQMINDSYFNDADVRLAAFSVDACLMIGLVIGAIKLHRANRATIQQVSADRLKA
jgi:ABC-type transport system involved in multi-copper enzyme maturation permease subunit